MSFTIHSRHLSTPSSGEAQITLTLERYNRIIPGYKAVKTLYLGTHNYETSGDFTFNGSDTPGSVYTEGTYRVKLEVVDANGSSELCRYYDFNCERSGFDVKVGGVLKDGQEVSRLIPGETYTLPVTVKNVPGNPRNNYAVQNGRYVIRLRSESGQEIYRREDIKKTAVKKRDKAYGNHFAAYGNGFAG